MRTKFIANQNRTESGFHLLVILSLSDGSSSKTESAVLIDFLETTFSGTLDLIKEQAFLKALPREEYDNHFSEVAAHFLSISTIEDRHKLLEFAMKVIMADKSVNAEENRFVNMLYDLWDMG